MNIVLIVLLIVLVAVGHLTRMRRNTILDSAIRLLACVAIS